MKIKSMLIKNIKLYKNNPRNNEESLPVVIDSIRDFGFKQPIVIDKKNVIVIGHTRLEAAIELEMTRVPVVIADDLTSAQIKKLRLIDNRSSELSTWDEDKLGIELKDIVDIDRELFDFMFKENDAGVEPRITDEKQRFRIFIECNSKSQQQKLYKELMSRRGITATIEGE